VHLTFLNPAEVDVRTEIDIRTSRGIVKDWNLGQNNKVQEPIANYDILLDMFRNDEIVARCSEIISEWGSYRGFDFIRGTKSQRDKARKKFKELKLQSILPNILLTQVIYGDTFIEKRKKNGKLDELFVLETTSIKIKYDKHGKVEKYIQNENTVDEVPFTADQIIHIPSIQIGSNVYSYTPFEPIASGYATKKYGENYIKDILINMPPMLKAHLKGASKEQRAILKAEIQRVKVAKARTLVSYGTESSDLDLEIISPDFKNGILEILNWFETKVLRRFGVPAVWVQKVDTDNRGNAEATIRPFEVKICSMHQGIAQKFNQELLPDLKLGEVALKFNLISDKIEAEVMGNVMLMKEMGLKPEALIRYLDDRGLMGFDKTDFVEPDPIPMSQMAGVPGQPKVGGLEPPSKKAEKNDPRMQDMTNKRDSRGVSADGARKLKAKGVDMRTQIETPISEYDEDSAEGIKTKYKEFW